MLGKGGGGDGDGLISIGTAQRERDFSGLGYEDPSFLSRVESKG